MYRYLTGVAKAAVKRKARPGHLVRQVEAPAWLFEKLRVREYTWLSYDDQQSVMFCRLCRKHQITGIRGKNAFITGTDNF